MTFRPMNIDPKDFESARKNLISNSSVNEKVKWYILQNGRYGKNNLFYLPGRDKVKFSDSFSQALSIGLTPSNFFNFGSNNIKSLSSETICSKFAIETYKLILQQLEEGNPSKYRNLTKKYMDIYSNTTPCTLEGYLRSSPFYSLHMILTSKNVFDDLGKMLTKYKEKEVVKEIYIKIKDKFDNDNIGKSHYINDFSHHLKARLFVANVDMLGLSFSKAVNDFLLSQAVYPGQEDAVLMQFKEYTVVETTVVDEAIKDSIKLNIGY